MADGELITRKGLAFKAKIRGTVLGSLSSISGTFEYGETVTGGTSTATGEVLYFDSSDAEIIVGQTAGATAFQNGETITGSSSGATATTGAAPTTAWQTSFVTVARVQDNLGISRQRPVNEIVDFDSDETEFTDKIAGNQSASASGSIALVPGNEGFQLFEAAMDYNLDLNLWVDAESRDGSATRDRYYTSLVTGFDESYAVADAASVSFSLELSDVSKTDPT